MTETLSTRSGSTGADRQVGPILYMRGLADDGVRVVALLALPAGRKPPALRPGDGDGAARAEVEAVLSRDGFRVFLYRFALPRDAATGYRLGDAWYPVDTHVSGDLRIAYASCNGQESGDRKRIVAKRDILWTRMRRQHEARPYQLLLHGGDQLYADETVAAEPAVHAWHRSGGHDHRRLDDAERAALIEGLQRGLFARYLELYSHPDFAWLAARVPSLAMWDDHDICDGWGSLPGAFLDSDIGQALFGVARAFFLLFQMGSAPDALPSVCLDPTGTSLAWRLRLPSLDIVAPDLRSERRPTRVMGEAGWEALDRALAEAAPGRLLLMSSVPALGPRLSWIERLLRLIPTMQRHEDDLRDQWQSHAHRDEWRTFLKALIALHRKVGHRVTVLSGEIHLATRATLETPHGLLHQLVASGITHPAPPKAYARALGALARVGQTPVPGHPIRLRPLPGRRAIYVAQRNFLHLERRNGAWHACWELERDGTTPPLPLG